jgi:hypothetical protein
MKRTLANIAATAAALAAAVPSPARAMELGTTLRSGVRLHVVTTPFDPAAHRLEGCGSYEPCLIDGHRMFGAVRRPRTMLSRVRLEYGNAVYELDVTGMFDPLIQTLHQNWDGDCYDERNCTLRAVLGDAGGIYAVEWQIVNGTATRTVLTDSMDVVHFFQAHLLAPKYE